MSYVDGCKVCGLNYETGYIEGLRAVHNLLLNTEERESQFNTLSRWMAVQEKCVADEMKEYKIALNQVWGKESITGD